MCSIDVTKTRLYNFDPFKPHFYIVQLGFTGVYIIFHISARKHRLWVLVRTASPRRFQRVPTIYVLSRKYEKYQSFLSENFQFLEVKFSIYLNRRVFVMLSNISEYQYIFEATVAIVHMFKVSSGPLFSFHTFSIY